MAGRSHRALAPTAIRLAQVEPAWGQWHGASTGPGEGEVPSQTGGGLLDERAPLWDAPFPPRYRSLVTAGHAPGTSAVALGVVAQGFAIPAEAALLAFCHSYVVGVLGAALRLLPLTHRDAQRIRHRLGAVIAEEARSAADRDWRDLSSFSPAIDVIAMLHETDDVRMFAS